MSARAAVIVLLALLASQGVARAADLRSPSGVAAVHVYRPHSFAGLGTAFDVYAGETFVCTLKEGGACVALLPPGEVEIWSRFLGKGSVTLDVEAGREYYVRGSVTKGPLLLWRPHYAEVQERVGRAELERLAPETGHGPQGAE